MHSKLKLRQLRASTHSMTGFEGRDEIKGIQSNHYGVKCKMASRNGYITLSKKKLPRGKARLQNPLVMTYCECILHAFCSYASFENRLSILECTIHHSEKHFPVYNFF